MTLLELAEACERAEGEDRALNRQIALAVGWHRYTPSELGRSNPGWIAPEDFIGEMTGKGGRKSPILDSLHGTEIWREPRNYVGSLDAAMQLVPAGYTWCMPGFVKPMWDARINRDDGLVCQPLPQPCATPALALTIAALRARHAMENENDDD